MKEKSLSEKSFNGFDEKQIKDKLWFQDVKETVRELFCKENQVGIRESNDGKKYKIYMLDEEDIIEELGEKLTGESK